MILNNLNKEIKAIVTARKAIEHPSYQIVYEWEDIFKSLLNVKFEYKVVNKHVELKKKLFELGKKFKDIPHNYGTNKYLNLVFIMQAKDAPYLINKEKYLPIIIDFWKQDERFFLDCPKETTLLINSLEAVNYLHTKGYNNYFYFPISMPDNYYSEEVPSKSIDVIQIGRKNKILSDYMHRYLIDNPKVEYLEQKIIDNKFYYVSSNSQKLIDVNDRDKYMRIIKESRISLLSSPGIDNSRNTGGYNPVTPRFLESASQYCKMIGRFPENEDFNFFNIGSICKKVDTYDQFETTLTKYLNEDFNQKNEYDNFLKKHLTSQRVFDLMRIINNSI